MPTHMQGLCVNVMNFVNLSSFCAQKSFNLNMLVPRKNTQNRTFLQKAQNYKKWTFGILVISQNRHFILPPPGRPILAFAPYGEKCTFLHFPTFRIFNSCEKCTFLHIFVSNLT